MPRRVNIATTLLSTLIAFSVMTASRAFAQQETVLGSFCSQSNCSDGEQPYASLISDSAGNLYGSTALGGAYDGGTLFEMKRTAGGGWSKRLLYNFGNGTDGADPTGTLIFDPAGNLYGTTAGGGTHAWGTVFELSPKAGGGWTESVLYNFGSLANDGRYPQAGLIFDSAGNLYGTTGDGGSVNPKTGGTVFELSPQAGGAWTEQVLYSFGPGKSGYQPAAGVIFDSAGNLYGATVRGGGANGKCFSGTCGVIFELTPSTGGSWTETVVLRFNNSNGAAPSSTPIFDSAGNLYGTTERGGSGTCAGGPGCGTVFELSPVVGGGWSEKLLYSFGQFATDGLSPQGALIFDSTGNLYGTTFSGGQFNNHGTAFELTPSQGTWTETILHDFGGSSSDGQSPWAGLILNSGNLYGTTVFGGPKNAGTIFQIKP